MIALAVAQLAVALAPFSAVDVAGDVVVDIEARGADSAYEETTRTETVKLEVKDRTLYIVAPPSSKQELHVRVAAPALTEVRARLSARVTVTKLDAKSLAAGATDSSQLVLVGKCSSLVLTGAGSARIDARRLENQDARVTLERAARALVAPTGSLDAELKGATVLDVTSKPRRINKKVSPAARLKLAE